MGGHFIGSQWGFSPLAQKYSGETNMKKKDIIGLQHHEQTKINLRLGKKSKIEHTISYHLKIFF